MQQIPFLADVSASLTKFRVHAIRSRERNRPCAATAGVRIVHVGEISETVALLELVHETAAALKTTKEDNEGAVLRSPFIAVHGFGISVILSQFSLQYIRRSKHAVRMAQ